MGRVVALEGSKVEVRGEEVLVDGNPATNPTKSTRSRFDVPEVTVPRRCYFVLADLRGKGGSESYDSRHLGPIPQESITHTFKPLKSGG